LCVLLIATTAGAKQPLRYVAKLADETRLEHDDLVDWHAPEATPRLGGRPLLAPQNPLVWLLDRQQPPSDPPAAFIELFTGDRLPGAVIGYRHDPPTAVYREWDHWIVRAAVDLRPPKPVEDPAVRVVASYVRRVVWQRRNVDRYQPGTVFCRDGRTVSFRSARFRDNDAVLLLTEGTRSVRYDEISELHLPAVDFWERYYDELATLAPETDTRLIQVDTIDGLVATTSLLRFTAVMLSGGKGPDHWVHGIQPAWSLDVLWVPHQRVWMRRLFAPHEVPLSRVPALRAQERPIVNQSAWPPQTNRNARGGVLRCGPRDYGWGIGVHAYSELHFPASPLVVAFRSEVGLDRVVGGGGCVQARVFADDIRRKPLFESPMLVGSTETAKTGRLAWPAAAPKPRELVLQVDPAHASRPAGADPLDIRDTTDWLDPVLELDPAALRTEVHRRVPLQLAAWQGWTLEPTDTVKWPLVFSEPASRSGRYLRAVAGGNKPLVWSRTFTADSLGDWLIIAVAQGRSQNNRPRIQVRVNAEVACEQDIPFREPYQADLEPMVVPLRDYRASGARELHVEVRQSGGEPNTPVEWRGVTMHHQLPMLATVFEDAGRFVTAEDSGPATATIVREEVYSGQCAVRIGAGGRFRLSLPQRLEIRESPGWGQFRLLRFAVRKRGQGRVGCELNHFEAETRPARYDAGTGEPCWPKAKRAWDQPLPDSWVVVTRDLYADFGTLDLTAVTWVVPDGTEALFDQVYVARHADDFRHLPPGPSPEQTTGQTLQTLVAPVVAQVQPVCVAIDFRDGRFGTGTIVSRDGHVLTAGHLVLAPDRDVTVQLGDGRRLSAKTRGVYRTLDLGLVKITEPGSFPAAEIETTHQYNLSDLYLVLTHRRGLPKEQPPSSAAIRLRRVLPGEVWTPQEMPDTAAGGPLFHRWGKLVGVHTHRSGFGGFVYSTFGKDRGHLERMKRGEVWGGWKLGTGPLIGVVLRTTVHGCQVAEVLPHTAAAKRGLRTGDTVRKIRGQAVASLDDANQALAETQPGDEVEVEYERSSRPATVRLSLAPRDP
jgi:hypothetical protein